ncbi:HFM1 [Candida pseudojiufengensis]|uniref:HFM1 n=1 Tax=Candida pseudojiufengensis TaxID=497109 RepID=UPI0022240C8B|nr:HFM1 [Candida pseudojiufengensis]KAI5966207.1 HFM1 [Candida pseudojiufengensis]
MSFLNNLNAFLDGEDDDDDIHESERAPVIAKPNTIRRIYNTPFFEKTNFRSNQKQISTAEPLKTDLNRFRYSDDVQIENLNQSSTRNTNYSSFQNKFEHIQGVELLENRFVVQRDDSSTNHNQNQVASNFKRRTIGPPRRSNIISNSSGNDSASTNLFVNSSFSSMIPKLKIDVLPPHLRCVFPFDEFNEMQSKSFHPIYGSSKNCVISAPTGSGKTVLFELAILKAAEQMEDFKALYLAPTKALCSERKDDWTKKFSPLGITVGVLTGDSSFKEAENVRTSKVIISTPEKWDMITRKWKDYKKLFGLIKLLLVDEVHILKETRGATLEVVMTRMKRICSEIRILAISATIANVHDIANWLDAEALNFGDEYRAVRLKKIVSGYKPHSDNEFSFDNFLNTKLIEVINKHSNGKPVLIFCATRNSCQGTAKYLSENYLNRGIALKLKDKDLANYVKLGVAFHHAGLVIADRKQIESAFLGGSIKYLCCTSTLAVGMNLPAYLVVIKGTKCWFENSFQEYTETDVLQMIGRAGRPQFEKDGVAVIMTNKSTEQKYERLLKGTEKVESTLHLNFAENLLAEIAVGNINSIEDALSWLKTTYLYVRLLLNPSYYKLGFNNNDESLMEFCKTHTDALEHEQLMENFKCTAFGFSMIMHYITFNTMKAAMNAGENLTISDLLDLLSNASEYSEMRIKHQEKKLYKEINKSPLMRYPSESKVKTIIQFELGGLEFPEYNGAMKLHSSFIGDKFYIFKHLSRILTAIMDVFVEKKQAVSLINSSFLMRSISGRGWEGSPNELRQLEGVGLAAMKKFVNHNVLSIADAKSLTQSQIEHYLGIKVGAGAKHKKLLSQIPSINLQLNDNGSIISVKADVSPTSTVWKNRGLFLQFISSSAGKVVDFRRMSLRNIKQSVEFEVKARNLQVEASIDIAGVVATQNCRNMEEVDPFDDDFEFDSTPNEFGLIKIDKTKSTMTSGAKTDNAALKKCNSKSTNVKDKDIKSNIVSSPNVTEESVTNTVNPITLDPQTHEKAPTITKKPKKIKRKTIFSSSSDSDFYQSKKKVHLEKKVNKEPSQQFSKVENNPRLEENYKAKPIISFASSSSSDDLFKVSKKISKVVADVDIKAGEIPSEIIAPIDSSAAMINPVDTDLQNEFSNVLAKGDSISHSLLANTTHEQINYADKMLLNSSPTIQASKFDLVDDVIEINPTSIADPKLSSEDSIYRNFKAIKGPIDEVKNTDKFQENMSDESLGELQKFFGEDVIIEI